MAATDSTSSTAASGRVTEWSRASLIIVIILSHASNRLRLQLETGPVKTTMQQL